MRDLIHEIRLVLRALRRAPGFTVAAVLTMAAALGGAIVVFAMADAVLLRPLPFRDAATVVSVALVTRDTDRYPLSVPDYLEYRRETRSLVDLAAGGGLGASLTGSGDAERLQGMRVSGNLFTLLGVSAEHGRTLLPDDDRANAKVVVLTHGLVARRFASDPSIVGRSITLNGEPYEVVGILPEKFRFMTQAAEFAVPLAAEHDPMRDDRRAMGTLRTVGRLAPGATPGTATLEMSALAARLSAQYPDANATKLSVRVAPYQGEVTAAARPALLVLAGAMGCVLLIACANLAGLLLVRASGRRREMAVRAALGATRGRLARLILLESACLAAGGVTLGILLATWATQSLSLLGPRVLPRAHEIALDGRALLFAAGVAALSALLIGAWPAILASRTGLQEADGAAVARAPRAADLGPGGRSTRRRARGLLVVVEVALAMILLAGAGLFIRSFGRLLAVDPGFDSDGVLIARLALPKSRYAAPETMIAFHDRLRPLLLALPGVTAAGFISISPMSGPLGSADYWDADHPPADLHAVGAAQYRVIGPGCFAAFGMRLLRGRDFEPTDDARAPGVVIVNRTLAEHTFGDADPIGRSIMIDDSPEGPRRLLIVGLVEDVRHESPDAPPVPDVHVPIAQVNANISPWLANNQFWALRATGNPALLARAARAAVASVDPEVAASDIRPLDDYLADSIGTFRLSLRLITLFATASLALAAMGLYGLIAYSVGQRTREIGIRMALGARAADVERQIVGEGVRLAGAGLLAGLAGALLLGRMVRGLLFGIPPHDPATFTLVALLLGGVILAASWLPSRRAGRVNPAIALRAE
jgi:putative ABC transport system permease protein